MSSAGGGTPRSGTGQLLQGRTRPPSQRAGDVARSFGGAIPSGTAARNYTPVRRDFHLVNLDDALRRPPVVITPPGSTPRPKPANGSLLDAVGSASRPWTPIVNWRPPANLNAAMQSYQDSLRPSSGVVWERGAATRVSDANQAQRQYLAGLGLRMPGDPLPKPPVKPTPAKVMQVTAATRVLAAPTGTSGAIRHGGGSSYTLGERGGDSGAVNFLGGNQSYKLGERHGDAGAIDYLGGNQSYKLGARHGDPGMIDHLGGNQSYKLGARHGDSGAINWGGGNNSYTLGERRGDGGVVHHLGKVTYTLGQRRGDSGAIDWGGGNNSYTLGERRGSSGAVEHTGSRGGFRQSGSILFLGGQQSGTYTSGAIIHGGTRNTVRQSGAIYFNAGNRGSTLTSGSIRHGGGNRGNGGTTSGSITHGTGAGPGSGGSSGGGSTLGGGSTVGGNNKPRKLKKPVPKDGCCGTIFDGDLDLDVLWSFDEYGNPKEPQIEKWRVTIDDAPWTPPNWEDYTEMPGGTETISAGSRKTVQSDKWGECLDVQFDAPDPKGELVFRQTKIAAQGQEIELDASPGHSLVAARAGLVIPE